MLYSRRAQYAVRAMAHLAGESPGRFVPIHGIARATSIPQPFLSKIVQVLTRQGLLSSQKGPGGGVMLARPPADITLGEVVVAIDGATLQRECFLGLPSCSETSSCSLHPTWKRVRADILAALDRCTLADAALSGGAPLSGAAS